MLLIRRGREQSIRTRQEILHGLKIQIQSLIIVRQQRLKKSVTQQMVCALDIHQIVMTGRKYKTVPQVVILLPPGRLCVEWLMPNGNAGQRDGFITAFRQSYAEFEVIAPDEYRSWIWDVAESRKGDGTEPPSIEINMNRTG